MCFPRPAPRCSRHAREALATASAGVVSAKRALREDYTLPNLDAVDAAVAARDAAEEDFRVSLAGIRALRDAGDDAAADTAEADRLRLVKAYLTANPDPFVPSVTPATG